jgi:multiple sugar transport system ATP-binding protein
MASVEIRNLHKHFEGHRAVDGVDLSVQDGEFVVLLGPSGCGKTTLLRTIAGLEDPTSGEIRLGERVLGPDVPPRARRIAMMFQSYALYPHRTVYGNIAFPLKATHTPRATIEEKVRWAVRMFDIERYLERYPRHLSGGERQRVALCRAVVREPQAFLLDEPLSNLDAKQRTTARDELKRFQEDVGITTVYVTHDQVEAMGLGDRIAVMKSGKVRQFGTPREVYEHPADTFVATFVGLPPMNLLEAADGLASEGTLVGFRPEHFLPRSAIAEDEDVTTLRYHVRRVEYLGSDRFLYGSIGEREDRDRPVIARLPAMLRVSVDAGRTHEFAVPTAHLRYFDEESGLRRDPPAGAARRAKA